MLQSLRKQVARVVSRVIMSSEGLKRLARSTLISRNSALLKWVLEREDNSLLRGFLRSNEATFSKVLNADSAFLIKTIFTGVDETLLKEVLERDGMRLLKKALIPDQSKLLTRFLAENQDVLTAALNPQPEILHNVLRGDLAVTLKALDVDNGGLLRECLIADNNLRLLHVLDADDRYLLRAVLTLQDGRRLSTILAECNYAWLKDFLREQNEEHLTKLLAADDMEPVLLRALDADSGMLLKTALTVADGRRLGDILTENGYARLKDFLQEPNQGHLTKLLAAGEMQASLLSALDADGGNLLKAVLRHEDSRRLGEILVENDYGRLKDFLQEPDHGHLTKLLAADEMKILRLGLEQDDFHLLKGILEFGSESYLVDVLQEDDFALLGRILEAQEAALLRGVMASQHGRLLKKVLQADNEKLLRDTFTDEDAYLTQRILTQDESRLLKFVLAQDGHRLLRKILLSDDQKLLFETLELNDKELLEKALDNDGYRLLIEVLEEGGNNRLLEVLNRHSRRLLKNALRHDNLKLLMTVLREENQLLLRQALTARNGALLKDIIDLDDGTVLNGALTRGQMGSLKRLLVDSGLFDVILHNTRLSSVVQVYKEWDELKPLVADDRRLDIPAFRDLTRVTSNTEGMHRKLAKLFCDNSTAFLANGTMEFPEFPAFWVLIQEILLREDYYFATDAKRPRILDCGTHFGMSIYYFKQLYPMARITGFEPDPKLRELALSNIQRNNFSDVEILPYAISDSDEDRAFLITEKDSMAGSLTRRREHAGDEVEEITVACRKLSHYLNEPIHFLKLDIEGVEAEVLEEAAPHLNMVEHIFCEYHQGHGLAGNRLERILSVLHHAGFDVTIGKAYSADVTSSVRPMSWVSEPYALSIWARNSNWSAALSTLNANAKVVQKESKGPPGGKRALRESASLALGVVRKEDRRRSQNPEL